MSSFRLFRVAICGLDNMKNFSVIHKLQRLVVLEYALTFAMIFHEIAQLGVVQPFLMLIKDIWSLSVGFLYL